MDNNAPPPTSVTANPPKKKKQWDPCTENQADLPLLPPPPFTKPGAINAAPPITKLGGLHVAPPSQLPLWIWISSVLGGALIPLTAPYYGTPH